MYEAAIKLADAAIVESARYRFYGGSSPLEPMYELKGKSYLREKRYEAAYNAYRQQATATRYDSERDAAEASMRSAAQQGNLYEKWIPEQLKKVTEAPDDLDARFTLAQSYEASTMIKEAIAQYQKISELQPDSWQWHKKLGDLYDKQAQQPRETGEVIEGAALLLDGNSSFEISNPEQLAQAAAAYESALQLDPNSYELYRLLAEIYKKGEQPLDAEKVYRRALSASLRQSEYNAAVKAILNLYTDEKRADQHITLLEELKSKMPNSAALHELLGDAYKKVGDTEKAKIAYNHWIKLRQREINREQGYWYYSDFAEKLLNKGLYPETALKFAKRSAQRSTSASYILTLGHAYLANEQYDEALEEFILGLNTPTRGSAHRDVFSRIAKTGKNMSNQEHYHEMLDKLVDAMSHNLKAHLHLNLVLAEFYRENDMPEKAKTHNSKHRFYHSGFVGGYSGRLTMPLASDDTAYIPEDLNADWTSHDIQRYRMDSALAKKC